MTETEINNLLAEGITCIGCGARLQVDEPEEPGYVTKSALASGIETDELLCRRCFRLRHYNEIQPVSLTADDFRRLLANIADAQALIVFVVDIFDVTGSMVDGLQRYVGQHNDILVVGNKADILPKSLKRTKLKDWLRRQVESFGIRPVDVLMTSAIKGEVDALIEAIDHYRQHRDVYVVGVTNVGKSTLINQIIASRTGVKDLITTSRFPGTTLDRIEIPLDDGKQLIDTPGIIHADQMAHYLDAKNLKLISPKKEIKPRTYQLNAEQTVFLGGLARFDLLQTVPDKQGFTFYFDNELPLHRTKLAGADEFYDKHKGDILKPYVPDLPELKRSEFKVTEPSDLVVNGLGWVTVPAGTIVAGWAPEGVSVQLRKRMI